MVWIIVYKCINQNQLNNISDVSNEFVLLHSSSFSLIFPKNISNEMIKDICTYIKWKQIEIQWQLLKKNKTLSKN